MNSKTRRNVRRKKPNKGIYNIYFSIYVYTLTHIIFTDIVA